MAGELTADGSKAGRDWKELIEDGLVLILSVPRVHGKEHLISGVVMNGEECNGGPPKEKNCLPSLKMASQPEMSHRMKQLLHGVRLSMAAEYLDPASDLEELARRLDADRNRRNKGSGKC